MAPYSFPPAHDNGKIVELFPDVFAVEGKFPLMPGAVILRTMTILRQGTELCIINSVRLKPDAEADLDKLGTVKHVVRMTPGHGCDDPYYVAKYKAQCWAWKGMTYPAETGLKVDKVLSADSVPFPGLMEAIQFDNVNAKMVADGAILIKKEKGILVGSDALQSYDCKDLKLSTLKQSWLAGVLTSMMGFKGRCNTVPVYFGNHSCNGKASGMKADFEKLKAVEFDALIPPHGTVVKAGAKSSYLDSQSKINYNK